jgi:hypothetical protein
VTAPLTDAELQYFRDFSKTKPSDGGFGLSGQGIIPLLAEIDRLKAENAELLNALQDALDFR